MSGVDYSDVHCNYLNYISSGINIRDIDFNTQLHENTYTECARGVDLGYIHDIGYSYFSGQPVTTNNHMIIGAATLDTWSTPSSIPNNLRVCGQNTPNQVYFYETGVSPGTPHYPFNLYAPFPGLPPLNITMHIIQSSLTLPSCASATASFSRDTMIGDIVWDTIIYSDYALERRYIQINNAYRLLDEDTAARLHLSDGKDSMYSAFYYKIARSNIGKYHRIEKLIYDQNYEDASDSLALITDTNRIEELRHIVLDVYLNKILTGTEISEEELDDLDYIAHLCNLEGGPAVNEARNILAIDVKDSCVVEEERWAYNYETSPSKLQKSYYFSINPNPADNFILVNYSKEGTLSIWDIAGRKMNSVYLSSEYGNYYLSVADFSPGVYFYSYKPVGGNAKNGKFVVK